MPSRSVSFQVTGRTGPRRGAGPGRDVCAAASGPTRTRSGPARPERVPALPGMARTGPGPDGTADVADNSKAPGPSFVYLVVARREAAA